jgi:hypothetical protein
VYWLRVIRIKPRWRLRVNLWKTHVFKYDIIIAPELVNTKQEYFEQIHDMLEMALAPNGMIFFSGRTHYNRCDGSMSAMLDIIKSKNCFDIMERSIINPTRSETAPRKVVQLMQKIR